MATNKIKGLAIRGLSSKATLPLVAVGSIFLAAAFLPAGAGPEIAGDPVSDAEMAYQSLMDELGQTSESTSFSLPEDPGPSSSAHQGKTPTRLGRNLFAPSRRTVAKRYDLQKTDSKRPPRRLPPLTGIMIDGYSKQAYLAGVPASEGESVMGYTVIQIAPEWVIIERDGTKYRLVLGGNQ
jgi:hypothetical protein